MDVVAFILKISSSPIVGVDMRGINPLNPHRKLNLRLLPPASYTLDLLINRRCSSAHDSHSSIEGQVIRRVTHVIAISLKLVPAKFTILLQSDKIKFVPAKNSDPSSSVSASCYFACRIQLERTYWILRSGL